MKKFQLLSNRLEELSTNKIINENASYFFDFKKIKIRNELKGIWKYFDLLPLNHEKNIVSLGEGNTSLKRIKNLEKYLNNAKFYVKAESENPEGTFKDREASYVISKAKELNLKKIVFHSTGNTGRAYSLYSKKAGIESYFFIPLSCMEKCNLNMTSEKNHIIAVDGKFKDVSSIAKFFSEKNNITVLAPLHDKLEGKATIAYEQFYECPKATIFVQTIAGGYGILGFLNGHYRLRNAKIEPHDYKIPKILAIQPSDMDTIKKAFEKGLENLTEEDFIISKNPFEKTLQSTNPLKTFKEVRKCIIETNGRILSVSSEEAKEIRNIFEFELMNKKIRISYDNEKSPFLGFAGLVKAANQNIINKEDIIYFVLTGSGKIDSTPVKPDAILIPSKNGYKIKYAKPKLRKML